MGIAQLVLDRKRLLLAGLLACARPLIAATPCPPGCVYSASKDQCVTSAGAPCPAVSPTVPIPTPTPTPTRTPTPGPTAPPASFTPTPTPGTVYQTEPLACYPLVKIAPSEKGWTPTGLLLRNGRLQTFNVCDMDGVSNCVPHLLVKASAPAQPVSLAAPKPIFPPPLRPLGFWVGLANSKQK